MNLVLLLAFRIVKENKWKNTFFHHFIVRRLKHGQATIWSHRSTAPMNLLLSWTISGFVIGMNRWQHLENSSVFKFHGQQSSIVHNRFVYLSFNLGFQTYSSSHRCSHTTNRTSHHTYQVCLDCKLWNELSPHRCLHFSWLPNTWEPFSDNKVYITKLADWFIPCLSSRNITVVFTQLKKY